MGPSFSHTKEEVEGDRESLAKIYSLIKPGLDGLGKEVVANLSKPGSRSASRGQEWLNPLAHRGGSEAGSQVRILLLHIGLHLLPISPLPPGHPEHGHRGGGGGGPGPERRRRGGRALPDTGGPPGGRKVILILILNLMLNILLT